MPTGTRFTILLSLSILAFSSASPGAGHPSPARDGEGPWYVVRIAEPASGFAEIEARFKPQNGRLTMGGSGAAKHLERGFATYVRDLTARDRDGRELPVEALTGANWQVSADGPITLSYRVLLTHDQDHWPFGYDEAAYRFDQGLFFVAEALLVRSPGLEKVTVRFEIPAGWKVTTPWTRTGEESRTYEVETAELLGLSCIILGLHDESVLRAGESEIVIASGRAVASAVEPIEGDLKLLLDEYTALFGGGRSGRFLIVLNQAPYNGAGAYPSSISILTTDTRGGEHTHPILLYMLAHEVLHLWNGRQLVPKGQAEWFKEGFTDYLTLLSLARTHLITESELYDRLAEHLDKYRAALDATTIAEAGEKKAENYDLVYSGGATVALVLDLDLRSRGRDRSLDQVMRQLFERHAGPVGFGREQLLAVLKEVGGRDYTSLFERSVDGLEPLPVVAALDALGIRLAGSSGRARLENHPSQTSEQQDRRNTWLQSLRKKAGV